MTFKFDKHVWKNGGLLIGFQMPAWFDLMSLDPNGVEDDKGIQKSKAIIVKLIEEEISNGIDPSR